MEAAEPLTKPLQGHLRLLKEDRVSKFNMDELRQLPWTRRQLQARKNPRMYLRCQWERGGGRPSKGYLLYRCLHLVVLFLCLALSLGSCPPEYALKCYIYMTTWAQCFHLYQAIIGVCVVTLGYYHSSDQLPAQLLSLYGAHHSTSVALALAVTFVYWVFIFEPGVHQLTMAKVISHGVNSLVMLLDLMLVAHPVVLSDIAYPLGFGSIYALFTVTYYYFGGTNAKGDPYVYKILDWNQPLDAVSFAVIGMCILSIMFLLVWLLATLRSSLATRLKPSFLIVHI